MTTKWRGALLYSGLLAASTATFALRTVAFADDTGAAAVPATSSSQSGSGSSPASSGSSPGSSGSSPASSGSGSSGSGSSDSTTKKTTVQGDTVQTRFGPIQVRVSYTGDQITDVVAVQYPDGDGKSQRINELAIPRLRAEVLSSQSADIDTVSGATYTSEGYRQSLQSAIDHH